MADDVRKAAYASMFYPEDKLNLKRMIKTFLSNVPSENADFIKKQNIDNIFGIISPHAGYIYSGQVAAFGYSLLKGMTIDTIIIIGPSHHIAFEGFSLCNFKAYDTPLGEIPIDREFSKLLIENGNGVFDYLDSAHTKEHSIEVQLPFLYSTLINNFSIVPIIMGEQSYENVVTGATAIAASLEKYDKSTLFVISTDLSHYYNDKRARELDEKFIDILNQMDAHKLMEAISHNEIEACGAGPVAVFLELANQLGKKNIKNLIYKNSGDTSGDYSKVVGYLSATVW
jgi:MEMO1 family protein